MDARTPEFTTASELSSELGRGFTLGRSGDAEGAETAFVTVLHDARCAGNTQAEVSALHGLGINAGATGRTFEAYALLYEASGRARATSQDAQLFRSLGGLQGALFCLRLYDAMPEVLDEMSALLARMSDEDLPPWGDREILEGRYCIALERGTHEEALAAFQAYDAAVRNHETQDPVDDAVMRVQESRLWTQAGDIERAETLLREAAALGCERPNVALHARVQHVETLTKLGRRDDALAGAATAIEMLESLQSQPLTCFDRLDMGAVLGRALKSVDAHDEAHRAFDLAAAAVLERIAQLDSCVQRLPELGLEDGPMRRSLIAMRKDFVSRQKELMQYVARMLTAPDGTVRIPVRGGTSEFVAICAWCERMRPEGDTWIPVGEFIPRNSAVRITHGICPTCAGEMNAV